MGAATAIEWTDASWTPIRARALEIQRDGSGKERLGWHCEHVSEACRNCYAEAINRRLGTGFDFKPGTLRSGRGGRDRPELFLDDTMLTVPLRWRRPRRIFVCSMTDLFAAFVPDEWIDRIFAVMALCPQHTFQVLTKRAERMRNYLTANTGAWDTGHACGRVAEIVERMRTDNRPVGPLPHREPGERWWPLPNVWLGVSAERQKEADERIPPLLATPAAVRFVSAEPLLGPIDFTRYLHDSDCRQFEFGICTCHDPREVRLDWIIVGGESGPNARPFDTAWAASIVEQCRAAGVACFVKQLGAHVIQGSERRIKRDRKGGDMSEWPHDLRIREFPAGGAVTAP